jgi:hypothetical protein
MFFNMNFLWHFSLCISLASLATHAGDGIEMTEMVSPSECADEISKFGLLVIEDLSSAKEKKAGRVWYALTGGLIATSVSYSIAFPMINCWFYGYDNLICLKSATIGIFGLAPVVACCSAFRVFARQAKEEKKIYKNKIERAQLIQAAYAFLKDENYDSQILGKCRRLNEDEELSAPAPAPDPRRDLCRRIALANEAGCFVDMSFLKLHKEKLKLSDHTIKQLEGLPLIGQLANYKKNIAKTVDRLFYMENKTLEKYKKQFQKVLAASGQNKNNDCVIEIPLDTDTLDVKDTDGLLDEGHE